MKNFIGFRRFLPAFFLLIGMTLLGNSGVGLLSENPYYLQSQKTGENFHNNLSNIEKYFPGFWDEFQFMSPGQIIHQVEGNAVELDVYDCEFEVPSNDLEDGHGFLNDLEFANDFSVDANTTMTLKRLKAHFSFIGSPSALTVDLTFYEDSGAGPDNATANPIGTVQPVQINYLGEAFNLPVYSFEFNLPNIVIENNTDNEQFYWVGISANYPTDVYWEITSETLEGSEDYFFRDGVWNPASVEFDMPPMDGVMKVTGECDEVQEEEIDPCDDKTQMDCRILYTATLEPDEGAWTSYPDSPHNYTGSEKVWEFTATQTGEYEFDLAADSQDVDFFLMDDCSNTANNLLDGFWTGTQTGTVELNIGQTVYLIADLRDDAVDANMVAVKINCPEVDPNECSQGIPSFEEVPNAYGITIGETFRVAEDFTVDHGVLFSLNRLTFDINTQEVPNFAEINIREDDNGMPGAVLETISGAPDASTVVGSAFGDPIHHLIFVLETAIELEEGVYWIDPQMSVPSGDTVWWAATDEAFDGGLTYSSNDDGASWTPDDSGLDMVFTVSGLCEILGVNDLYTFDFAYYPNPIKEVLNIHSGRSIDNVSVFNMVGQNVLSIKEKNLSKKQIDVSGLTPGVYVFRVVLEGGRIETFKVVKQ